MRKRNNNYNFIADSHKSLSSTGHAFKNTIDDDILILNKNLTDFNYNPKDDQNSRRRNCFEDRLAQSVEQNIYPDITDDLDVYAPTGSNFTDQMLENTDISLEPQSLTQEREELQGEG